MNMFETDYSNLFAAGLRVIESRSTDRTSLSAESQPCSSISPSTDRNQHPLLSSSSSSRKAFHYPTRLWRRPSPRNEKTSSADSKPSTARSKPTRRRSLSGGVVEETALDVRIWDWSTRVSNATTILEEEDECVDPYLDKVDPVDAPQQPFRTTILVALPNSASLWEHELPPLRQPLTSSSRQNQSHREHRRVSLQTLPVHRMLPTYHRSNRPLFDSKETVWESGSASSSSSSSDEQSGLDDDWHQFRVEWIDFD